MKVVSIINYKGGVGKTTITSNLAAGLSDKGYKVLAIDLDPQCNLTFSYMNTNEWADKYSKNKTIINWFKEDEKAKRFKDIIINPKNKSVKNIDLICSHTGLINTDASLASRINGATNKEQQRNFINAHNILKEGLNQLKKDEYDIVLIDCPPSFNLITRNALVASSYYLVPVRLDYLSTLGINELNKHIKELKDDYNENVDNKKDKMDLQLLGIVCNMVTLQKNKLISSEQETKEKLNRLNVSTFKSMLRENKITYSNASKECIPAIMKKASGDTYKSVKNELESLVKEFIEKVGL